MRGASKTGADDFIAHRLSQGKSVDEIRMEFFSFASDELPEIDTGSDDGGLPRINTAEVDLPKLTEASWEAVRKANAPERLFMYGDAPVRIDRTDSGQPWPKVLNLDRLRHEAARAAFWFKPGENGRSIAVAPPIVVIQDMLASPTMPLPVVERIIEAPTFVNGGLLHAQPGYSHEGRSYYCPTPGFVVPAIPTKPTQKDIDAARSLISDELLGDFPFVGQAERANATEMLLLMHCRGLISGPTPAHLIEKPTPGTGATLMADVMARIATGRAIEPLTEGRDDDEWRKRLTARLRTGPPIVLIDNVRRRLDSGQLAAAITSDSWRDRILGMSDEVRIPIQCVWAATGNNPGLSNEMARRTIRIRLDSKQERPWLRNSFRHSNIRAWALEHRADLVHACLLLVQAWIVAGRPRGTVRLGMFEEWAATMGGILQVAGIDGFLGNLAEFYDATDSDANERRALLAAWLDKYKDAEVGIGDVISLALSEDVGMDLGEKGEHSQKVRLGKILADMRDRAYQLKPGQTIRLRMPRTVNRAQRWKAEAIDNECYESYESVPPRMRNESVTEVQGTLYAHVDRVENIHQHSSHSLSYSDTEQPAARPNGEVKKWIEI